MIRTRRFIVYTLCLGTILSAPLARGQGAPSDIKLEFRNMEQKVPEKTFMQASEVLTKTVSLRTRDTELQDVLRLIAFNSGLNIIMSPEGVKGKVTLHLENVRLSVVLENLLKINDLAYIVSEEENIIRIVPASSVGIEKVETNTDIVQVDWVTASIVAETLQNFVSKNGKIVADVETNSLILTDTPPNLLVLKELIVKIDQPERQVLIEARLVEMRINAVREIGSNVSFSRPDSQLVSPVTGPVVIPGTSAQAATPAVFDQNGFELFPSLPATPAVPEMLGLGPVDQMALNNIPPAMTLQGLRLGLGDQLGIFGQTFDVSAVLAGYEERKIVEILANPRVMTLNNIPADISMTQEIPYIDEAQNDNSTAQTAKFKESGVKIEVTPIITPNSFVRMSLHSSQMIDVGRFQGVPIIDTREATTNVIVQTGETVMIGGLRQLNIQDQREGTPWFQNIPVLGWMFKHKLNGQVKTDLYLFVTPTVVETPVLKADEKGLYDRIDLKWDLPDYFFDDVSVDEDMN